MIIGIYGYQDSGKTRLVENLVRTLVKKGYKVSSIKHTPHDKTIDCEGKDTWRHWKAGSDPVVFSSETETTVIKHSETSADDIARMILAEFRPDVIVIEGFKEGAFPKVAIGHVASRKGTVLTNPKLGEMVKYVETEVAIERVKDQLPSLDCGKCGLDCDGLARAIVAGKKKLEDCKELSEIGVQILVGGKRIAAGKFVSSIVDDTVRGMLSSLRGYGPGKVVEIRLEPKKPKAKTSTRRK
jgi:molybdopterin-guanine dinucleotide biosynthesis protein B